LKPTLAKQKGAILWAYWEIPIFKNSVLKGFRKMSEEKGNLKGLAISFILISLIMGAGIGIVYFVGQGIY
jgi:hypothetical protein